MSNAKQSEILFLWDGENWNPNGDVLNANAPRYDEASRKALVSDVRVKRTIRDYLRWFKGEEIFVREEETENGESVVIKGQERIKNILKKSEEKDPYKVLTGSCIDVRLFGGVFTVKGGNTSEGNFNLTGPVQFKMSKSLNETEVVYVKGTGAFASGEGKNHKTFREEFILPYAIFATYGIISEMNAKKTGMSEIDATKLLDGLWNGTKNLVSRSKFGQTPLFLLKITYDEPGVFIGGLDNLVGLETDLPSQTDIRSVKDYKIDLGELVKKVEEYKESIKSVKYVLDDKLRTTPLPEWWTRARA